MTDRTPATLDRLWDEIPAGDAPVADLLAAGRARSRRRRRTAVLGAAAATVLAVGGGVLLTRGDAGKAPLVGDGRATELTVRVTYGTSAAAADLNVAVGHAAWNDADHTLLYVTGFEWSGTCPPVGNATLSRARVELELAVPGGGDNCTADARSVTATVTGLDEPPGELQVVDGGTVRTVAVEPKNDGGETLVDLPTSDWRPGDPSMLALIHGTLAVDDHQCPYFGNPGTEPMYAVWPAGFTATVSDTGRLTIYDADGVAVAHNGDDLTVGGGLAPLTDSIEPSPCLPEVGSDVTYIQSEVPLSVRGEQDHGNLTDEQYAAAVRVAQERLKGQDATITSATVRLGEGTVRRSNVGYECTSGRLLHIKLIGTFPHTVTTGHPVLPGSPPEDFAVHAVIITADAASGRACLVGVQTGDPSPPKNAVSLDLG